MQVNENHQLSYSNLSGSAVSDSYSPQVTRGITSGSMLVGSDRLPAYCSIPLTNEPTTFNRNASCQSPLSSESALPSPNRMPDLVRISTISRASVDPKTADHNISCPEPYVTGSSLSHCSSNESSSSRSSEVDDIGPKDLLSASDNRLKSEPGNVASEPETSDSESQSDDAQHTCQVSIREWV
ncbi:unnamed protein product [Echinostoma caproni]|uniref:PDE4_UCR domain-containing protein n=1 Tax=Echinostoma caproni TaxID=27848 RepID=A0A183B6V6_9TREM|nr:unnamed protein product [Echinostoma caproni]